MLGFCLASHEILVVVTPEPTSLTDAYALLKILSKTSETLSVNIIVNQVKTAQSAQRAFSQLRNTVNAFLPIQIYPLGVVVTDRHVGMAVISQIPLTLLFPDATATRCIKQIGKRLFSRTSTSTAEGIDTFWKHCLLFLSKRRKKPLNKKELVSKTNKQEMVKETDIFNYLEKIEKNLQNMMEELKTLKTMIKDSRTETAMDHPGVTPAKAPEEIILDFETWLSDHHTRGIKNSGIE